MTMTNEKLEPSVRRYLANAGMKPNRQQAAYLFVSSSSVMAESEVRTSADAITGRGALAAALLLADTPTM